MELSIQKNIGQSLLEYGIHQAHEAYIQKVRPGQWELSSKGKTGITEERMETSGGRVSLSTKNL